MPKQLLEEDGNRTNEDREDLASCCQRHSQRDAGADALMADDDEDGRDDRCESRIRRHGGTDVHPAECEHLQRTTEDDARRDIAEDEAHECARDEWTMELALIEHRPHTGDGGDDDDAQEL